MRHHWRNLVFMTLYTTTGGSFSWRALRDFFSITASTKGGSPDSWLSFSPSNFWSSFFRVSGHWGSVRYFPGVIPLKKEIWTINVFCEIGDSIDQLIYWEKQKTNVLNFNYIYGVKVICSNSLTKINFSFPLEFRLQAICARKITKKTETPILVKWDYVVLYLQSSIKVPMVSISCDLKQRGWWSKIKF